MAFTPGSTAGPYRLIDLLGKGGMGEVYRAQDTRLGREVALKVLPDAFLDDPDRLSRFEREARVLASLNHPNIATLLGFSQIEDRNVLEMELVRGETLAERLRRGAMPLDEALLVFRQIAQALEAAHEQGIIHRDLKPTNIKVLPDGRVKVLDFGLAKAFDPQVVPDDVTKSPSDMISRAGAIVGTARYMSPEQARGKPLDRRTDIWSFGCVFYEALAGQPPFVAETSTDVLASVLKDEPDWRTLAQAAPAVHGLIRRCVRKDLQSRLRDIADARIEIEALLNETTLGSAVSVPAAPQPARWSRGVVAATVAGVLLAVSAPAVWMATRDRAPVSAPTMRVSIPLDQQQRLMSGPSLPFALSPDGSRIVYVASRPGARAQIFQRSLDRFDAMPVAGTEGASAPFFSPDGEWIGFHSGEALHRISVRGGVPLKIADVPAVAGATWADDDTILFATTMPGDGLWRVAAAGGAAEAITKPDTAKGERHHTYPKVLPGAEKAIFTIVSDSGTFGAVLTIKTRAWNALPQTGTTGGSVQFLAPGHLVYSQAGGLMASAFDVARGELHGPPLPMLERIAMSDEGVAYFDVAPTGALVYLAARTGTPQRTLVLVDRSGRARPLTDVRAGYVQPRFSPDGRAVAVAVESETGSDIWLHDLQRRTRTRLTNLGTCRFPVWSADSTQVTFQTARARPWSLFSQPGDGSGPAQALLTAEPGSMGQTAARLLPGTLPTLTGANSQYPASWSRDSRTLAFVERKPSGERDIWVLERGSDPRPFVMTPFDEWSPAFSPDGRFLAYVSDEAGSNEVYVQPFPDPGAKYLISIDGGTDPAWSPDGKQLFYRRGTALMAATVKSGPTFATGSPEMLFEGHFESSGLDRNYDVEPGGQEFLMVRPDETDPPPQLNLVLNWGEELKTRVRR